jgi:hypothetical protein
LIFNVVEADAMGCHHHGAGRRSENLRWAQTAAELSLARSNPSAMTPSQPAYGCRFAPRAAE